MVYKDLDEQALAKRCRDGDRLAEDELYKRYAARVYTICRRYANDSDEAKDLMQESMIQALDKIRTFTFTVDGSLNSWIRRIAINKAINHIRRHRWRIVSLDEREQEIDAGPPEDGVSEIPQEKLLEWIASMTEMRRTVFNLYCIDGYSHKEISKMLSISEKGSAGILAKARKQLKEVIKLYLKETGK